MQTNIKKSDDELQIVWVELYVPDVPDTDHDYMTAEEIMKMSYRWMSKSNMHCIDIEHNCENTSSFVVESFIARKGDPDFIEGAWVTGIHVPDSDLWSQVRKGQFNGVSMYGLARRGDQRDMEIPAEVEGVTKAENGHTHTFNVAYGPEGEFIGGQTDEVDGHYHIIRRGTVTEKAEGHAHAFDFVRGVLSVEEAEG